MSQVKRSDSLKKRGVRFVMDTMQIINFSDVSRFCATDMLMAERFGVQVCKLGCSQYEVSVFVWFCSSEWAQVTYPEHDLREKGKDWKACLAVMNEGARHIRLKDRKRKVRNVFISY